MSVTIISKDVYISNDVKFSQCLLGCWGHRMDEMLGDSPQPEVSD